jgi:hypothetical protein
VLAGSNGRSGLTSGSSKILDSTMELLFPERSQCQNHGQLRAILHRQAQ